MKISFFIGEMRRGGAERVISILANHYAAKGWDVDIVMLLGNSVGYELNGRIQLIDISQSTGSYYKRLPKWLSSIRDYVKENNPDKIVSFIGRINLVVLIATIGMKVPVIVSERNDPKQDGRSATIIKITNYVYKFAKKIVYQTEYEKTCFSKALESKAVIIPNPIIVQEQRSGGNGLTVVTAGRLLPQKNHNMLIDAIGIITEDIPNVVAEIYGDGGLKAELQKKIANMGLENNIKLCGNVNDLHRRMAGADVFVMTSEFEGLSNSLLEAMMMGFPCVATNYSGVDELIINGQNGIIVPKGDSVRLAQELKRILKDRELQKKLSEGARCSAEKYKYETIINQWESVIG